MESVFILVLLQNLDKSNVFSGTIEYNAYDYTEWSYGIFINTIRHCHRTNRTIWKRSYTTHDNIRFVYSFNLLQTFGQH